MAAMSVAITGSSAFADDDCAYVRCSVASTAGLARSCSAPSAAPAQGFGVQAVSVGIQGFVLRDASLAAQDEDCGFDPHGEERCAAPRLEP